MTKPPETNSKEAGQFKRISRVLLLAVAVALGYFIGAQYGFVGHQSGQELLLQRIGQLEKRLAEVKREIVVYQTDAEISERAQENIRQELKEYREQIVELEKASSFYKHVLGGGQSAYGLSVERFIIKPLEESGVFEFQLKLAQLSNEYKQIDGDITLIIVGEREGEKVELGLQDVMLDGGKKLGFEFRYFQELEGRLKLPEGFEPENVRVIAKQAGANGASVKIGRASC